MAIKYKNLKAEMIRKSVSNGKMAEVLGVTEQTFRRKLTGDVSVTIDEAQTLMQTLFKGCGFTIDYLFELCSSSRRSFKLGCIANRRTCCLLFKKQNTTDD